jgi:plastocyanin
MHTPKLFFITAATLLTVAVGPASPIVRQKGRVFSLENIKVTRGQQVLFLNDDTVPHNIMSNTADNEFDLGSQPPGSEVPVSFDRVGIVAVICAIHPRMHMTITVTN